MDLNIHLNGSDTISSTCHLEIHVSEEVFKTLNISKQYKILISLTRYQTTGDTGNHLLDGHACCHQGHAGCTGGSHGSGTVGLKGLGYAADGVRELLLAGQNGNKCSLCQCSMTDLSSSGSAGRLGLANGVGREIIVMHIALGNLIIIQSVNLLRLR